MTTREPEFPPRLMAALRAPHDTTPDDFRRRFPHADTTTTESEREHPAFDILFRDAIEDWHERNGWDITMPPGVKTQLAQQIRDDLTWAQG